MNNITVIDQPQMLSAAEMRDRVNKVQEVMRKVMKQETHYGVIPGTNKPTLYKAGSEVLLTTFGIGLRLEVEDLSNDDVCRYRVKAIGFHLGSGQIVGEGIGECSSGEEKYKWRRAICDEEFETFPESRRRIKFSKWKNTIYQNKQVRTDSADYANTILKMAKKRAQIDFTLTALGASDIFTQDIEDLPQELRENVSEHDQAPAGEPIEHEGMKAAKTVQELATMMNGLSPDERKKYMTYFNVRRQELTEAEGAGN